MMNNCPVELVMSFKTFRVAPGAALKEISTKLRWIKLGSGVPTAFAAVRGLVAPRARAGVAEGFGVGLDDAACSSGNGRRRNDVMPSTLASSIMLMSI